jgi:thymidylate synthase ThyX
MLGVHKQVANRLLEPFAYVTSIISATEWSNFFKLRLAPDAQQEIQLLATKMKEAIDESRPDLLSGTEWHVPYISAEELEECLAMGVPVTEYLTKVSAARCARVSYVNTSGVKDLNKDVELFDRLVSSGHLSPLEHVAKPSQTGSGNFVQWEQLRKQHQGKYD